jgi:transcriptional regulator GlxA family with amidase domain
MNNVKALSVGKEVRKTPLNIQVLVADRCQGSGIYMVIDTLIAANYCYRKAEKKDSNFFNFKLIGRASSHTAYNGYSVDNVQLIDLNDRPDVLIVPGIIEAVLKVEKIQNILDGFEDYVNVIRQWHQQGTVIVASCSGNLLLAKAGIFKNKPLTTHWRLEDNFKALFPDQSLDTYQYMIDHGDLVSCAGASAISQMTLYMVERFHSRELTLDTARLMLIEPNYGAQSPFSAFAPQKSHDDPYVEQLQGMLEEQFQEEVSVQQLMDQVAISDRQLNRRFKAVTGETPVGYLQRLRIEYVRRGLETSSKQVNSLIWESGYEDVSSFRRLFKKMLGMTMTEYRQRYGLSNAA